MGGKSAGSILRPVAAQTVTKRLSFLRSAIRHAIERDDVSFDGPNAVATINVEAYAAPVDKRVMPVKRPFSVGDLTRVFQYPWFTGCSSAKATHTPGDFRLQGAENWVPITALLTGCRAGELGGLTLSEVRLDDPCPHLLIRANQHRRTKNGENRCVPILDALIEQGFADYVARIRRSGTDRLFPDWMPPRVNNGDESDEADWSNSSLIKAFNRTLIPNVLGDQMLEGARRDVTFHGFRGAFKSMLGSSRYRLHPNIIDEVVGHAKGELDRRYVGVVPIEETYHAIKGCTYIGLKLPPFF